MNDQVTIYALCDEEGRVRYIGRTAQGLDCRLAEHISEIGGRRRAAWVREVLARGLRPTIRALEVAERSGARAAERRQIADHLARGCALTNCVYSRGYNRMPRLKSKPGLGRQQMVRLPSQIPTTEVVGLCPRRRSSVFGSPEPSTQ